MDIFLLGLGTRTRPFRFEMLLKWTIRFFGYTKGFGTFIISSLRFKSGTMGYVSFGRQVGLTSFGRAGLFYFLGRWEFSFVWEY